MANEIFGWAGKMLRVNFTTGNVSIEDSTPYLEEYLGGMGLGYKIIYDEVAPDTHAYDEASKAVFAVGALTGSGIPCSGRTNISLLSSWTKGYSIVDAHMGGYFAHAMKYAGYDAIIIEGQSSSPVYLAVEDDKVTIEDASALWGLGTFEANRKMIEAHGSDFTAACIGEAGENLVNMSTIQTSTGNAGGAGIGAVMGSKKLKGIVIKGTGSVKVADAKQVKELSDYMLRDLIGGNNNHNVPSIPQSWAEYSSTGPNRWQGGPGVRWEKAPGGPVDTLEQPQGDITRIGYRTMKGNFDFGPQAQHYMVKEGGCSSCPIRCYVEYEMDPLADFDLPTKVSNTCMSIIYHNQWFPEGTQDFVNEGDATMILGGAGSWQMDNFGLWENYGNLSRDFNYCYKEGILEEKLPKEEWDSIPWDLMKKGDPRWIHEIMGRISRNEGELATLGLGSMLMAEKWGMGKEYYDNAYNANITYNGYPQHHGPAEAFQVGGLYNMMYNRDCMVHHITNIVRSGSPFEIIKRNIDEEFGEGSVDPPANYTPMNRSKAKLAKWAFIGKQWHDSATLCNWMYPMSLSPSKDRGYRGDFELDAKYMTAVTGMNWTKESLDFANERISHMLRVMTAISFKVHENSDNLRRDHDVLTAWVYDRDPDLKAFEEGTTKLDRDDMELAKDMFYEEMGWDIATGIPTRETLEKFNLGYMADDLEKHGILPTGAPKEEAEATAEAPVATAAVIR